MHWAKQQGRTVMQLISELHSLQYFSVRPFAYSELTFWDTPLAENSARQGSYRSQLRSRRAAGTRDAKNCGRGRKSEGSKAKIEPDTAEDDVNGRGQEVNGRIH